MLLIDATNLNAGGGGVLLKNLLDGCAKIDTFVLVSSRSSSAIRGYQGTILEPLNPLAKQRDSLLIDAIAEIRPHTLLCLGNIPPGAKIDNVRVVTYFQNAHLLKTVDVNSNYSMKDRIRYALLRRSIRRRENMTDHWVFQTPFIRRAFAREYSSQHSKHKLFPFFEQTVISSLSRDSVDDDSFVYVSDARPHKNHQNLISAWRLLAERSLFPILNLTVPHDERRIVDMIASAQAAGCKIVNHGFVDRARVIDITQGCQYAIFPSLLETVGLGMLEACQLGLRVLASAGPATEQIIDATEVFDPLQPSSIADSVIRVLTTGGEKPTTIKICNRRSAFVDWLSGCPT